MSIMLNPVVLTGTVATAAGTPVQGAVVSLNEAKTLTGEYVWNNRGSTGELEAVFTPREEAGRWNVAFHFSFRGKAHVYSGTATGDLAEGGLGEE